MKRARVGIIGFGFRAAGILSQLQALGEMFDVAAVCDRDEARLAEARRRGDFRTFRDHRSGTRGRSSNVYWSWSRGRCSWWWGF